MIAHPEGVHHFVGETIRQGTTIQIEDLYRTISVPSVMRYGIIIPFQENQTIASCQSGIQE